MTTQDSTTNENDFYTQVTTEIESGNIDQAAEMVMALKDRKLQTEVLSQLAGSLDHALDIRGANTLDLDRARALARARERANELAISLDLDHAHALDLAISRARTLHLPLDRAEQINKVISACLTVLVEKDKSHSALTVRVRKPSPAERKNNLNRIILITVFILLVIWVMALMVLRTRF